MFRALLHFFVLAALAAPASAQVFKWVDERGITHYGERPPQGAKASEVRDKLASPPPSSSQRPAPKDQPPGIPLAPQPTSPGSLPVPSAAPKAAPTPQEAQAAARKAQCGQARAALARLRAGTTSYMFNEKGERVTVDNSAAIAEQEKRVGEQCAN